MGDESKPKDVMVLGTCSKGLRVAVREGDELTKLAVLSPLEEGHAAPVGTSLVRIVKDEERGLPHAKMETLFESPYRTSSIGHEGPARVSTEAYRNNYDGMTWGEPSQEVN